MYSRAGEIGIFSSEDTCAKWSPLATQRRKFLEKLSIEIDIKGQSSNFLLKQRLNSENVSIKNSIKVTTVHIPKI
jgi:hypothetical protein